MKAFFKSFLFGLLVFGFLVAIGATASQINPRAAQLACKQKYPAGTIFNLSGRSLYRTWDIRDGEMIQDNFCDCVATLEFLEKGDFKFTFSETCPGHPPGIVCYGKMAASGELMFTYPVPLVVFPDGTSMNVTDAIRAHACATIWGPGINEGTLKFIGKFNGKHFSAIAGFMAAVASPCPSNDMFDPALHPGPLFWTFGYDLRVGN